MIQSIQRTSQVDALPHCRSFSVSNHHIIIAREYMNEDSPSVLFHRAADSWSAASGPFRNSNSRLWGVVERFSLPLPPRVQRKGERKKLSILPVRMQVTCNLHCKI